MNSFICHYCGEVCGRKNNLQRHIQLKHESRNDSWECPFCKKRFNRKDNYEKHRRLHIDGATLFECFHCSKKYKSKYSLIIHLGKVHNFSVHLVNECCHCMKKFCSKSRLNKHMNKVHQENSKRQLIVSQFRCGQCSHSFSKKTDIHKHYESHHHIELRVEQLFFQSYTDFQKWKLEMQKKTISQFHKRNIWKSSTSITRIFHCHRSGFQLIKNNSFKFPRQVGSKKLNAFCPSEIRVKMEISDGTCRVEYLSTHVGHILQDVNELRFIYLDESERVEIAAKLKSGALRQVFQEKDLVQNLEKITDDRVRLVNQTHPVVKQNDISSRSHVEKMNSFIENNKNFVLYYKKIMEPDDRFNLLNENDFVLIVMSEWQEKNLHLYGHKVIAFDTTHDTNQYELLLHTMLVLDVDREGVPVSFILTNRNDQIVMNIFLSCIRDKIGIFSPKVIMTDMQYSYHKSWIETMPSIPTFLYCTSHVIRAWKKNLLTKIKDSAKRVHISNALYDLLLELNPLSFEKKLKQLVECDDPDLLEFQNYFEKQYLGQYIHYWAYCFRQHAGINTNMAMDSFHKSLKYHVAKSLKMSDLTKTLCLIEKYLLLREEENQIKTMRGKDLYKLKLLRSCHHEARIFLSQCDISTIVTDIDGKSFFVRSFDNVKGENDLPKLYLVSKVSDNEENEFKECCAYGNDIVCRLPCDLCQICFHDYTCNCVEASIKSVMCKHIHAVGIFLQNVEHSNGLETCTDLIYRAADPQPLSYVNQPLEKSDEDTDDNRSSSVSSEVQKMEGIRRKMHRMVDDCICYVINNGGNVKYLEWIEKQYFQPMVPALHNYILMGTTKGTISKVADFKN